MIEIKKTRQVSFLALKSKKRKKERKKCPRSFGRKGRNHLNKLGVNRIVWILKKQEVEEWTIFIGIRIGTNDGVL